MDTEAMHESDDCIADILRVTTAPGHPLVVAFASMEGDMVDQHFGSAECFFVHGVSADGSEKIASKNFGYTKKDGNEDKLKPKLKWLAGCDIVYCGSIGGSATRQLVAMGITPLQVSGGPDVDELIESLQQQLRGEPEFWLANLISKKTRAGNADVNSRFELSDDEQWG